jgi:amino acid transporter
LRVPGRALRAPDAASRPHPALVELGRIVMSIQTTTTDVPVRAQYARKATGLVREVPLADMTLLNGAATGGPLGVLMFGVVGILAVLPRANWILAYGIGVLLPIGLLVVYAVFAATMPKSGGDYVYNGRILHPILGFGGNLAVVASGGALSIALWGAQFIPPVLGAVLSTIGLAVHAPSWVHAGATIQSTNDWKFAISAVVVLGLSLLSVFRTRIVLRVMAVSFGAAFIGFVVSLLILAFTSHNGFVNQLNSYGPGAHPYQQAIAAAATAGVPLHSHIGFSTSQTIAAMFFAITFTSYWMYSTYLAGEMKGGGRRNRQLLSVLGGAAIQGTLVTLAFLVFYKTVGLNFILASSAGKYSGPVPSSYFFLSAVALGGTIVPIILCIAVLGWLLPNTYANMAIIPRCMLAWTLDGLMPSWFGKVNDRTHTPVNAIIVTAVVALGLCAFAAYSVSFLTVLAAITFVSFPTWILVGISAIVMKRRRPALYDHSPADWKLMGVPVMPVAGVACVAMCLFGLIDGIKNHVAVGVTNLTLTICLPFIFLVVGAAWYTIARFIHLRRDHVDIRLAYDSIPPE